MAGSELFIECEPWEERVALREEGVLVEASFERPGSGLRVGSIYAGRVAGLMPGVQGALVEVGESEPAFLPLRSREEEAGAGEMKGKTVAVQVVRRPLNGKRAQVTRFVSLAGRHVVLAPGDGGVKVSRRIEDAGERTRLEGQASGLAPAGCGLMVRTAARGGDGTLLRREAVRLAAEWTALAAALEAGPVPRLLRAEIPLRLRALRDLPGAAPACIRVAPRKAGEEVKDAAGRLFPDLAGLVVPEEEPDLFRREGIDDELERLAGRRVLLSGGGSLVIDTVEAMTVVDVNSGSPADEGSPAEVALRTNLEAAREVPRQLRVRGVGGIVVIDFIDMADRNGWQEVTDALVAALRRDRIRTQVAAVSEFGLVELTRKRVDGTAWHQLTEDCPECGGRGRTISPESLAILVARKVARTIASGGRAPASVRVNPRLGARLRTEPGPLAKVAGGGMRIMDDPALAPDQFRLD